MGAFERRRPRLLKTALADVQIVDRLTAPNSEALKVEYISIMHSLDHCSDWIEKYSELDATWQTAEQLSCYLKNEPERSRRVARLLIANHLSQVDKPACDRTKPAVKRPAIYRPDPMASQASHALPPPKIAVWFRSSLLDRLWQPQFAMAELWHAERVNQASVVVKLAARLYRLEEGVDPTSVQDLVGRYLESVPEGYRVGMLDLDHEKPDPADKAARGTTVSQSLSGGSKDRLSSISSQSRTKDESGGRGLLPIQSWLGERWQADRELCA